MQKNTKKSLSGHKNPAFFGDKTEERGNCCRRRGLFVCRIRIGDKASLPYVGGVYNYRAEPALLHVAQISVCANGKLPDTPWVFSVVKEGRGEAVNRAGGDRIDAE